MPPPERTNAVPLINYWIRASFETMEKEDEIRSTGIWTRGCRHSRIGWQRRAPHAAGVRPLLVPGSAHEAANGEGGRPVSAFARPRGCTQRALSLLFLPRPVA